jgi:hypothetical protein
VSDPDGNAVAVKWWQYRVGTYPGEIAFSRPSAAVTEVRGPADARSGQTIHIILEATDDGSPALTRYRRLIVSVLDKQAPVLSAGSRAEGAGNRED